MASLMVVPFILLALLATGALVLVTGAGGRWVTVAGRLVTVALVLVGLLAVGGAVTAAQRWNDPIRVRSDVPTEVVLGLAGAPTAMERLTRNAEVNDAEAPQRVSMVSLIRHPRLRHHLMELTGPALTLLLTGGALWCIRRLVRRAAAGEPFDVAGVVDLRWLAAIVGLGGGVLAPVVRWATTEALVSNLHTVGGFAPGVTLEFLPLLMGALLLALAEVWRHGVALRETTEGLV
ncbi:MAG: DUF2975 domain-containing protein [Thermoleophilia bacterium]